MHFYFKVLIRLLLAVAVGGAIGSERAKHGRAAGIRTHILVALGSSLTSMTSLYVATILGNSGDIFRVSAQVISGVGFLGAGMIILKSNNMITGLTTAAGVWTTSAIGISIGYGFYVGAITVTVLFLTTIIVFAKFEKKKKLTEVIYVEIDDMHKTNNVIKELETFIKEPFSYQVIPPKSNFSGNIGINLTIEKRINFSIEQLCNFENVVYAVEDNF